MARSDGQFKKGNPGGGRPRKSDQYAGQIAKAERRIADRLPDLIDKMFVLAEGVVVQEVDDDGIVDIYQKPPDRQSIEYLLNRIMGKPTERKEHLFPDKPLEDMSDDELRAIVES